MDLGTLIHQMKDQGEFEKMTQNPLAQFGNQTRNREYIGARYLPEMMKETNSWTEEDIQMRSLIADDTTRYSPDQKKELTEEKSFDVVLGEIGAKREITAYHIDTLNRLLRTDNTPVAQATLIDLIDRMGLQSLMDKKELQRWQVMSTGTLTYKGTNKKERTISYNAPADLRFNATGNWSDDAHNPLDDIYLADDVLYSYGFLPLVRFCRRQVVRKMQKNFNVQRHTGAGFLFSNPSNQLEVDSAGRADLAQINNYLTSETNAPIVVYDLDYWDQDGQKYFLNEDEMIIVGRTPREYRVDDNLLLFNTLGYYGVGTPQAQGNPGDVIRVDFYENKPSRVEVEAYGTGLPVIQEINAIAVIKNIV